MPHPSGFRLQRSVVSENLTTPSITDARCKYSKRTVTSGGALCSAGHNPRSKNFVAGPSRSTSREKPMRRSVSALVAGVSFGLTGIISTAWADEIGFKKAFDEESDRAPDRTPAAEAFLIRAYPET